MTTLLAVQAHTDVMPRYDDSRHAMHQAVTVFELVGSWGTLLGAVGCLALAAWGVVAGKVSRWLVVAVAVVMVGSFVLASIPTGVRWQTFPVVLGGALAAMVAGLGAARRPGLVVTTAATVATAVGAASLWAFPPLRMPEPTGRFAVGTMDIQWDGPTMYETYGIVAQVWYPAASKGEPALYLGRDESEARYVRDAVAKTFGVPAFLLREAEVGKAVAAQDVPVADGAFPLVLFSPGDVSYRRQNTAWATELASHGYVVVALDHTFDSAVTVFQDDHPVDTAVRSSGNEDQDQDAADDQATTRAEQFSSALDELTRRNTEPGALLEGHLDLDRVAAAGHSLGGAAALIAAADDDRIEAAIDLDGLPRNGPDVTVPVLVLVAADAPDPGNYRTTLEEAVLNSPDARIVTVDGSSHLTFTDAPLFLPDIPSLVGSSGRDGPLRATTGPTLAFLEDVLS